MYIEPKPIGPGYKLRIADDARASEMPAVSSAASYPRLDGLRVLVVDDETDARDLLEALPAGVADFLSKWESYSSSRMTTTSARRICQVLNGEGIATTTANNGTEALSLLEHDSDPASSCSTS